MSDITKERWRKAQSAEAQYWKGLDATELLRISAEKSAFMFLLGSERCASLFDGKDVLEIGAGPISLALASFYGDKKRICRLVKIDPLPRIRIFDTKLADEPWVAPFAQWVDALTNEGETYQSMGEEVDFVEKFDCVVSYNVLDHVQNPRQILANAHRALRPGGQVLIGVDCLSVVGR